MDNWPTCKQFINNDLVRMLTQYDPTAATSIGMVDSKKLSEKLEGKLKHNNYIMVFSVVLKCFPEKSVKNSFFIDPVLPREET